MEMLPIIGWLGLSGWIMWRLRDKQTDVLKIKESFKNMGYGVKDHYPQLIRTVQKDAYTEYVYNVPYGLTDDSPKLQSLEKTLHKSVHIHFDGKLHIRVYKRDLPQRIQYDWQPTKDWHISLGEDYEGMVHHSFDIIPHMTIAGMTRQGKTVLLKLIFAHLIHQHPDDVEFTIIDLKGGLEFNRYRNLKQVTGIASDVYEAHALLQRIYNRIRADMSVFKEKGYTNILDTPLTHRRFVIVDEGAELTPSKHHSKEGKAIYAECQEILGHIARIGGALGYRLIFGTQYPTADTLPRAIKQNADAKISFRLPTEVASRVAIDEQGAERINNVGRAIYRTSEKKLIQVPYVRDSDIWEHIKEWECAKDRTEISTLGADQLTIG